MSARRFLIAAASVLLALSGVVAVAQELPTFTLNCNNGVFSPQTLVVPTGQKFKIEIHNTGTEAIEFESRQLRKEKALSPGGSSFVVVHPLMPGTYSFFDDFHIQVGQGSIIAK